MDEDDTSASRLDAVIVGAGFAGMYMLHRLRGLGLRARVLEAGDGVGGTWYWNRYPGARCDVESMEYSYDFSDDLQQSWTWTERYASQPEILRYAEHVADRFDLRRNIQFDTRVSRAAFDESTDRWAVATEAGDELSAQFLIMATGCLSSANTPDFAGLDQFGGDTFHTGRWPQAGVDFTGRRVGVIGTGSSGVQAIPIIAAQADHLTVFQRTAAWVVPSRNGALDPEIQQQVKADYPAFRAANREMVVAFGSGNPSNDVSVLTVDHGERAAQFEARWSQGGLAFMGSFNDLMIDPAANAFAADFVRDKIHQIVTDPEVADRLSPDTLIGCKRLCLGTDYYETYNRPNVTIVDVGHQPISEITPTGVRVGDIVHQVDTLVLATGFDAMTGSLLAIDIRGRGDLSLRGAWAEGPRTYLGLSTVGFPNLFTISGPGSPSVLTNMVVSIQQHVDWIADCVTYLRDHDQATIEATTPAQDWWVGYVNAIADLTLYPSCNSWYLGANVPGKPRVFMPLLGFPTYAEQCADIVAKGYEGFTLAG